MSAALLAVDLGRSVLRCKVHVRRREMRRCALRWRHSVANKEWEAAMSTLLCAVYWREESLRIGGEL